MNKKRIAVLSCLGALLSSCGGHNITSTSNESLPLSFGTKYYSDDMIETLIPGYDDSDDSYARNYTYLMTRLLSTKTEPGPS